MVLSCSPGVPGKRRARSPGVLLPAPRLLAGARRVPPAACEQCMDTQTRPASAESPCGCCTSTEHTGTPGRGGGILAGPPSLGGGMRGASTAAPPSALCNEQLPKRRRLPRARRKACQPLGEEEGRAASTETALGTEPSGQRLLRHLSASHPSSPAPLHLLHLLLFSKDNYFLLPMVVFYSGWFEGRQETPVAEQARRRLYRGLLFCLLLTAEIDRNELPRDGLSRESIGPCEGCASP